MKRIVLSLVLLMFSSIGFTQNSKDAKLFEFLNSYKTNCSSSFDSVSSMDLAYGRIEGSTLPAGMDEAIKAQSAYVAVFCHANIEGTGIFAFMVKKSDGTYYSVQYTGVMKDNYTFVSIDGAVEVSYLKSKSLDSFNMRLLSTGGKLVFKNVSSEIQRLSESYKKKCTGTFVSISSEVVGEAKATWGSGGREGIEKDELYSALGASRSYVAGLCYSASVGAKATFDFAIGYKAGDMYSTVKVVKRSFTGTVKELGDVNTFNFIYGTNKDKTIDVEHKKEKKNYCNNVDALVASFSSGPVATISFKNVEDNIFDAMLQDILANGEQRMTLIAPKLMEIMNGDEDEDEGALKLIGKIIGGLGDIDILGGVKKVGYEYSFAVLNVASGSSDLLPLTAQDLSSVGINSQALGINLGGAVTDEKVYVLFVGMLKNSDGSIEADLLGIGEGNTQNEDGVMAPAWLFYLNTIYSSAVNVIDDSEEASKHLVLKRYDEVKGTKAQFFSRKLVKDKLDVFNIGQSKVRTFDASSGSYTDKELASTAMVSGEKADMIATFRFAQGMSADSVEQKAIINGMINGKMSDIAKQLWPK